MRIMKVRKLKALSLILVLAIVLVQFAGLKPAVATQTTEIPITSSISNQTAPVITLNYTSVPVVSSSDPVNGAKNILTNKKITINFSESIQESFNSGAITVKNGDSVVSCTYSISGNSLSLKPTFSLEPLSVYTVTIPAGAVKDLGGYDLAEDYSFSFKTDNLIRLNYHVTDAVLDPVNPVMYITSKSEKKLYAVNYETGATSVLKFDYMTESLALGQGFYAGELYVALLQQEHSSYWWDEDQSGTIAVIDRESFSVVDTIYTLVDPFDVVAGSDGHLYIPSGSGQWTNFDSYNRVSKEMIHRCLIRQQSYALLHPTLERIYTLDTDSSPRDFKAYNISNGTFTDPIYPGGYDSPYHGDYNLSTKFKLDPTGSFIFNGSGNIFTTDVAQEYDMRHASSLGTGFSDIDFEPDLSRFYTLATNTNLVNFYNYDGSSFNYSHNLQLAGKGNFIFKHNGSLIVLTEPATLTESYKTGIQVIDLLTVVDTDPGETSIVPVNKNITINFNEEIMAGAAYESITLMDSTNNPVSINKTISGKSLTFEPIADLAYSIIYKVIIPAGAVQDTLNNPLKGEYTFKFSTLPDVAKPVISSTDPADGVTNLPINTTLTIIFNENVQQDVYFSDINLKNGNTLVGCNYSLNGNTLKITPNTNLAYSTVYTFSIPAGAVKDMANNPLNDGLTFSFTTKAAPSSGGGSSSTPPPPAPITSSTTPSISLNKESITTTTKQKDGQSVTTVTVNESTALETVKQSPTGSTIVIPVNETSNVVSAHVPPGLLVALLNKSSSVEIQTPTGSYQLPAGEIKMAQLAKELGVNQADVSINIIISQAKPQQAASITKFTEQHNLTQLVTPVEFQVEGLAGDKKVEVNNFGSYVSRTINLSKAVDPATTVGVVSNPDGTLSPVPTQFKEVNGKTVAVLKRKTNSTYSVVASKKAFADVKGHWAKEDIDTLASKLIIQGAGNNIFAPENKVSRAEVAALIVRALGLVPQPAKSTFRDIKSAEWYAGYVGTAVEAGIINGYADGTFKPNAYATREEVTAMLVRALKVAGLETAITDTEIDKYLAKYTDSMQTSSWAKSSLAVAAKHEIIKGNVLSAFAPANNTTRAELAVMVKRLLSKANFM